VTGDSAREFRLVAVGKGLEAAIEELAGRL
jgi:hypothetical protein